MKTKILMCFLIVFVLPIGLFAVGQAEGGGIIEDAIQAGVQAGLATAEQVAPAVNGYNFQKSVFASRNGMVACLSPLAAMMGVQTLAQGGNAFDAAIVTAAMLTVERPDMCGIAGHGIATIYDAKTGKVSHFILRKGHLWGKRDVTIPISAIDHSEGDTVHLKLDKQAINNLPSVSVKRHYHT